MYDINKKYDSVIFSCFNELRGTFTVEHSFHIILGAATINWTHMNEKYSSSKIDISKFQDRSGSAFEVLKNELYRFENSFLEFNGILTGIMNKIFIYEDMSAEKKLQEIFYIINSMKFDAEDKMIMFINRLVSIGISECEFNETPESIRKITIGLIDLKKIKCFADYCAGTSGVAIEIYDYLRTIQMHEQVFYYGEEINATNYLISKLLMIINKIEEYQIVNKDVLEYGDNYRELKFDFIVSDIPQIMYSDKELKLNDPRLKYGIPTRSSADWAFCQNVLYHLNDTGTGIIVGTKGTLVRSNEADIRKGILNDNLIECVITLPDNLYEKTSIGTEIIIFNKNKSQDRINRVLFINASKYSYRLNRNQHTISTEGIDKILKCYRYGIEEESFSRFVDLEKIKEHNYTLNPLEYLEFDVLKNSFDNTVKLKDIAQITKGVQVLKEDLEELSKQPNYYFLNVKDIENGRINYDETSMLTYKKKDWISKFDIKPNDIILTSKGSTVKIAIVEDDFRPAFISGNLSKIRVDPKKYSAYVLYEFMRSEVGTRMIEGLQTGTTIKLLNTSQLEKFEIPMFDIEFMNSIGHRIKENKIEYETKIEESTMIFEEHRQELMESLWLGIPQKINILNLQEY